jgi:hypothetical protein
MVVEHPTVAAHSMVVVANMEAAVAANMVEAITANPGSKQHQAAEPTASPLHI